MTVGGRIVGEKSGMIMAVSAKIKSGPSEDKSVFERDSVTSNSESNIKSGGNSLVPAITLHTKIFEASLIGTSLSYVINFERESIYTFSSGATSKSQRTGQNIQNISIFLESPHRNLSYGGSIDYSKVEPGRSKEDRGGHSYEYESSAFGFTTMTGFVDLKITDQLRLIPSLSYGLLGEGSGQMDKKDLMLGSLLARANF